MSILRQETDVTRPAIEGAAATQEISHEQVLQRIAAVRPDVVARVAASKRFQNVLSLIDMNELLDLEGGLSQLIRMCTSEDNDGDPHVQIRFTIKRLKAALTSGTSANKN